GHRARLLRGLLRAEVERERVLVGHGGPLDQSVSLGYVPVWHKTAHSLARARLEVAAHARRRGDAHDVALERGAQRRQVLALLARGVEHPALERHQARDRSVQALESRVERVVERGAQLLREGRLPPGDLRGDAALDVVEASVEAGRALLLERVEAL